MEPYQIKLLETFTAVIVLLLIRSLVSRIISKRLSTADFSLQRQKITLKALNLFYVLVFLILLAGVWGLKGEQVLAFVTSILAVLGVGFFAQWSLLSNITSGVILYFNHPLKIGDYINIVDKDLPLSGTIEDISLFFLHVKNDEGIVYTIPNSAVMQKTLTIGKHKIDELTLNEDNEQLQ
ncbi:MAG: mechanosensitive ion channel family protein [Bacteroidia bacterium]